MRLIACLCFCCLLQYDLIACFEQRGSKHALSGRGSDVSSSLSSSMADKQQATLGRIAAVRRAIDEDRSQAPLPNDDIRTFELLGEGTFGKVHRGLWRQTIVAIKIILLPANMSGAEKREKMVVWEAAISSSLNHPNIVQTYTYSIKPVKESRDRQRACLDDRELGSAVVFPQEPSQASAQGCLLNTSGNSNDNSSVGGAIHSFEVQLVLEYCDKGCLRDALDQGVFLGPDGLNYPAILDSAEDIARAMLHLHCNNVLHMDLKARNVMLASSGT
ncbi:kinase-like domain-containing protein [Dunaliella salina]|uniref:Kinase-like domain-containing protein n=1 Tax=Dunaliella salina TaxID=3046 RepID=A0ABQ7G9S8_DUNSA|nr:kinase-like domain-containing protein [Dunaliella salina]|eukprot:KAF5831357.1 kinase-like domain-containing protein [Dunaliella salina]